METRYEIRDQAIFVATRLAAERLAWDEESVRRFHERRRAEAERRREAKLPVTDRPARAVYSAA